MATHFRWEGNLSAYRVRSSGGEFLHANGHAVRGNEVSTSQRFKLSGLWNPIRTNTLLFDLLHLSDFRESLGGQADWRTNGAWVLSVRYLRPV